MAFTPEEALKVQNTTLKEQLQTTTDTLATANERIAKMDADEAERLRQDILTRSTFKAADLENKSKEELFLIQVSLDSVGAVAKSAGVKKSTDERKATDGLSVGRYDSATKTWIGGL